MKKILLFVISILFIVTLTSCVDNQEKHCPYDVPKFNNSFTIANTDIDCTITNNITEERFEFELKMKKIRTHENNWLLLVISCFNENRDNSYSWFSSNSLRGGILGGCYDELNLNVDYSNKSVVETVDDMIYINGDTTLYLSYKDLDDDMKEIFLNENFDSYHSSGEIRNTDNNNYYTIFVNCQYLQNRLGVEI